MNGRDTRWARAGRGRRKNAQGCLRGRAEEPEVVTGGWVGGQTDGWGDLLREHRLKYVVYWSYFFTPVAPMAPTTKHPYTYTHSSHVIISISCQVYNNVINVVIVTP